MENISHETYAEIRSRVYIGNVTYYNQLNRFVKEIEDENVPLLVLGESGSGKSSLLANWAQKYQELPQNENDFVILHFIGTTPASADYGNM